MSDDDTYLAHEALIRQAEMIWGGVPIHLDPEHYGHNYYDECVTGGDPEDRESQ